MQDEGHELLVPNEWIQLIWFLKNIQIGGKKFIF